MPTKWLSGQLHVDGSTPKVQELHTYVPTTIDTRLWDYIGDNLNINYVHMHTHQQCGVGNAHGATQLGFGTARR